MLYSAYFNVAMTCSGLTMKVQEVAFFAVSLASIGRFEHDVPLLILIFIAWQFVQGLSIRTKESVFFLVLIFVTILNRFLLINFSSIRFTVTHSLFYTHLYWWFCKKIENFTNFYYISFVYLNITLIIRWIFLDCHLCYLYGNHQLAKVFLIAANEKNTLKKFQKETKWLFWGFFPANFVHRKRFTKM